MKKIIFTTDPPGNTISKKTLVFTWQRRTILLSNIYFWTYQIILFPFFYKDLKKITRIKLRPVVNIENIHASQEFFRCLLGSNHSTQMQVKLWVTSRILLYKEKKCRYLIFPSLPNGVLLQGIWLFLSLHSTFLMDDLTHVYFEHFRLKKVNSTVSYPPPPHLSLE